MPNAKCQLAIECPICFSLSLSKLFERTVVDYVYVFRSTFEPPRQAKANRKFPCWTQSASQFTITLSLND